MKKLIKNLTSKERFAYCNKLAKKYGVDKACAKCPMHLTNEVSVLYTCLSLIMDIEIRHKEILDKEVDL